MMNTETIFATFARHEVDALLIGGMNFLLRHRPVTTFDVDFWIRDTDENLARAASALRDLGAEWGHTESTWSPIPAGHEWLRRQSVFCLTSREGAIDIFRDVRGLEGQYEECRARALACRLSSGVSYLSLSDQDMLACQLVLPEHERRLDRIAVLQKHLASNS